VTLAPSDPTANLVELVQAILRSSRGMSVDHIVARLQRQGLTVDPRQVSRAIRSNPTLFRRSDAHGTMWALQPQMPERKPQHRVFRDQLPPLRSWQAAALATWEESNHKGIIQAITGAGKTLVAIAAIRNAAASGLRTLVIVPTTPLVEQWEQSLLAHLPGIRVARHGGGAGGAWERQSADVLVSTIQSAAGAVPAKEAAAGMLLVADEAHHYAAKTFRPVVRATFSRRLGLTATLQRSDGADLSFLVPTLGPVVFELTYLRALEENVVAPFDVSLIAVSMGASERSDYQQLNDRLERLIKQLRPHLELSGSTDDAHGAIVSLAGRGGDWSTEAREYVQTLDAMRALLDTSPAKMDALEMLSPRIKASHGTLVFTQTVALAQSAARRLNSQGVTTATLTAEHSAEERRGALQRFASGQVMALIAPQLLDEGIDVPEADLAVVLSASRTRRQMVQRMGRVIRPKATGGRAHFAIIFGDDTREDPAHGAHSAFLEEVLPLAGAVERRSFPT